jgi:hypothetical protein
MRHLADRQGSRIANKPLEISAAHGTNDVRRSKDAVRQFKWEAMPCAGKISMKI